MRSLFPPATTTSHYASLCLILLIFYLPSSPFDCHLDLSRNRSFPFILKKLNQNNRVWRRQLGRFHAWLRDMEVRWRTDKERIVFLFSTSPTAKVGKSQLRGSPNHYPYIRSTALLISFLRHSKKTMSSSSSQNDFPFLPFQGQEESPSQGLHV